MFKDAALFWKNFRLGTELQVAGTFIYNGLFVMSQMEHFYFEEQIFEVLYNLSVGIERLEKIAVILIEHMPGQNQEDFEKTLITHNHIELFNRIKKKHQPNLGKPHIKFLQLLSDFYRSDRYKRYNVSSVYESNREEKFIKFLEESLNIKIDNSMMFSVTPNDDRIRGFIGKLIEKISLQLYEVIRKEAARLSIFVYEIRSESKAYKLFVAKQFTFEPERYLQRELFVHLLRSEPDNGFKAFMDTIPPLPFEIYHTNYYIKFLMDFHHHINLQGELDTIAEDEPLSIDRIEQVKLIGTDVNFSIDEEFEDE
jgi:hypothetical protein